MVNVYEIKKTIKFPLAQMEMLIGRSHTEIYLNDCTLKGQRQMRLTLNSLEFLIAAAKRKRQSGTAPYTRQQGLNPFVLTVFFLLSKEQMWTKCSI